MGIMTHQDIETYNKVIFTAMSKKSFYLREHIVKYVLEKGFTPSCAFMMFSYFLLDTVERQALISANNTLIRRSDELWVFGEISNGVKEEIKLAQELNIPVKYLSVQRPSCRFIEVSQQEAIEEKEEDLYY